MDRRKVILLAIVLRRRRRRQAIKSQRRYWVNPILRVRYVEGALYTLFEKLKANPAKFFNYFRMSRDTFDYLVDRIKESICLQDTRNEGMCTLNRNGSSNIKCGEKKCPLTCNNKLDCYILDNNAYIVLSDEPEFIGRYIGDIRPDILNDLVEDGVFIATRMFDYQGNCQKKPPEKEPEEIRVKKRKEKLAKREKELMSQKRETTASSNASSRLNLIVDHLSSLINWIIKIFLLTINLIMADDTRYYSNKDDMIAFNKLEIVKTVPTPCDTEHYLFNLNQSFRFPFSPFRKGNKFDCSWPYAIEKIPQTNLLFLAANSDEEDACKDRDGGTQYFIEPKEIVYKIPTVENITLPCYIARTNNYTRRMYMECHNRNKEEDHLNSKSRYYCGHTWD